MSKERVQVIIDGMEFCVIGSEDKAYVQGLATELNDRLQETYRHNARLNDIQCHILTALNILDEKAKLERQCEEIESSGGGENASLYIKERDEAKEALKASEEAVESKDDEIKALKNYLDEVKEQIRTLKEERDAAKEAGEKWEEEEREKREALDRLGNKNYEAQMRIADLSKEISVLRAERDRTTGRHVEEASKVDHRGGEMAQGDNSKYPVNEMVSENGHDMAQEVGREENISEQRELDGAENLDSIRQNAHTLEAEEDGQDEMDEKIHMIYGDDSSPSPDANSN